MNNETEHERENNVPSHESDDEDELDVQPLHLTRNEVLFIDDMLSMMIASTKDDRSNGDQFTTIIPLTTRVGFPAPFRVIEKFMYAVLFTTDPDNNGREAVIHLERSDLQMLREIASTNIKRDGEAVGYNLKRKIYGALYGEPYHRDKIADQLLSQIPEADLKLSEQEPLQSGPFKSEEK